MNEAAYREAEQALWRHYGLDPKEHDVLLPRLGSRLRVVEVGDGDPVLFVHGGPTAAATWAPLVAEMQQFRCLVMDRPGCGLSAPLAVTRDNAAVHLSHLVTDTLDALGVDRAHLVGSSVGSPFVVRARGRSVGTVHMGAPWLWEGMPLPAGEKLTLVPGIAGLASRMKPSRRTQLRMHRQIGHSKTIDAGRLPAPYWDWYDALMRHTDTFQTEMRALQAFQGRGLAYRPDLMVSSGDLAAAGRTHVVWGSDEPQGGASVASDVIVDRIPGATLAVVDDAGHLPWIDNPAEVAHSTTEFFKGIP